MDGWKGKGGGKFDGGKGKGKGKGGKGFKGGKDQPMVVPQQVFNPLGHQDQFKGGKGKGKGHSHHHHHHQMTHHHHHHHQHQHHHHHHHHQHQHHHHHHHHQHQHSHHHHHQHQQQRHQKQQRPAAVPPPPPPAAVTVTDEMLVLPPLAHAVAAPVTLSYKRVQRLLLDIVQSHRHRLHLPHSLLSLVCHYAASSESSLPFALPSSAPVTIGEGAMPSPNSGREGTNVSVVLFASPDKESSSAAHSLTLVVKKSEKDGVHLLMGGSANEGEEHVAAAKRHVLEQSGIDLSDLPKERFVPFVDFTYRHDGKDLSSHVLLVNTWDEPSTLEATGVVKATLATLLSGPEGKSMSSFELLATSDMLLEVLERTLGARLLDTLAARKASEPTTPLTSLELSILDTNALGPIDSLTGLIDRARLENVAGALEYVICRASLFHRATTLQEGPVCRGAEQPTGAHHERRQEARICAPQQAVCHGTPDKCLDLSVRGVSQQRCSLCVRVKGLQHWRLPWASQVAGGRVGGHGRHRWVSVGMPCQEGVWGGRRACAVGAAFNKRSNAHTHTHTYPFNQGQCGNTRKITTGIGN